MNKQQLGKNCCLPIQQAAVPITANSKPYHQHKHHKQQQPHRPWQFQLQHTATIIHKYDILYSHRFSHIITHFYTLLNSLKSIFSYILELFVLNGRYGFDRYVCAYLCCCCFFCAYSLIAKAITFQNFSRTSSFWFSSLRFDILL